MEKLQMMPKNEAMAYDRPLHSGICTNQRNWKHRIKKKIFYLKLLTSCLLHIISVY